MKHRVAITGMGVVSPIGNTVKDFCDNLLAGVSGIGPITCFDSAELPTRIAGEVKKAVQSAIANAENNHDLDVDALVVSEASVGKSIRMKRFRARARGRASQIIKPFSRIRIVVREQEEEA